MGSGGANSLLSSSEDEDLGWSVPGDYLQSLFDLSQGYLQPAAEDSSWVMPEQPHQLPYSVHCREDGSLLLNDEDDS